jgi:alkaline phosphatase D
MGYQAWYENMPVSPRVLIGGEKGLLNGTAEVRIYEKYAWGKLADLHLLDNRQYRSKQIPCGLAGAFDPKDCKNLDDPQRSMLGATQEKWLLENLERASKTNPDAALWNCILQPLVFSQFLIPVLGGRANSDNWDGYPVSRQRIIETCKKHNTRNPVMFGGDIHQNWAAHITEKPVDAQSPVVMPEFVCTSISTLSFTSLTAKEFKDLAPHCVYTDRHLRGYGLVDITPERLQVDFRVVDNIHIPNSKVTTAARFEVKADKPVMQKIDVT